MSLLKLKPSQISKNYFIIERYVDPGHLDK